MKRIFVYSLWMLFCTASGVQAQSTGNATADIEVLATLTVTNLQSIQFGQVQAGTGAVTLDKFGDTGTGSTGTTTAGKFEVSSTGSQTNIQATFSSSVTLTEPGLNTITFSPAVYAYPSDQVSNATAYTSGTSVALSNGKYYFWVGGGIDVGASKASGTYTGTFTLSVSYPGV